MKKIIFILFMFCTILMVFAQNKYERSPFLNPIYNGKTDYIFGYQYLNYHSIEMGIARGNRLGSYGWAYSNYNINGEILKNNKNTLIGLKSGFNFNLYLFINVSANIINYTNFIKNTLIFKPEIGPSIGGIINLNYGYNFFLNNNNFNINKHTIALRMTIGEGIRFNK